MSDLQILYRDNHLLIVNKSAGMFAQGDSTGDTLLSELVKCYLIDKYNKPGRAFVGVMYRIDGPTSGAVLFAKISKALVWLSAMFQRREIHKVYHAVVCGAFPQKTGEAKNLLYRDRKQSKSYVVTKPHAEAKRAWLAYERFPVGNRYSLLAATLYTGWHHQICTQLSHIGYPIKGDLKYGAPRSDKDGGISLHVRILSFKYPVTHGHVEVVTPYPEDDAIWSLLSHTK